MELSRKINLYLVVVVAVAVAHAGLAVATSLRFRSDVERVANEYLPSVRAAEELEIALLEQRGYVASHLLADGDVKWLQELRGRERSFDRWLAEARRTSFTDVEIEMLNELERLYADYVALRDEVVATYQRGEISKAKAMLLNDLARKHEAAYVICERYIDQIAEEIQRLENVVHSLLEFARPPTPKPRAERVELLVEKAGELVQHRLREQAAKLEVSLADGLPTAWVDAEQARQVLLNLLNNALDATPSGGVVRIAAAPVERSGVAMVRITVRDEGGGLTEESQRRLFEPFHTTKPHGTGLGLAIAASIMASQGGAITLEHTASDGTEFAVWIPQSSALPPEPVFANEGAME
jgi:signal transduction histidine kinase